MTNATDAYKPMSDRRRIRRNRLTAARFRRSWRVASSPVQVIPVLGRALPLPASFSLA